MLYFYYYLIFLLHFYQYLIFVLYFSDQLTFPLIISNKQIFMFYSLIINIEVYCYQKCYINILSIPSIFYLFMD
jgi:hypothetical protein